MITFEKLEQPTKIHGFVRKYELLLGINEGVQQVAKLLEEPVFAEAITETIVHDSVRQLTHYFKEKAIVDQADEHLPHMKRYFDENNTVESISDADIISIFRIAIKMAIDFFYNIRSFAINLGKNPKKGDFGTHWDEYSVTTVFSSNKDSLYKFGSDNHLYYVCEKLQQRFKNYLHDLSPKYINKEMVATYSTFVDIMFAFIAKFPRAWRQLFCIEQEYGIKKFQPFWFSLGEIVEYSLMPMIDNFKFPEFIIPVLSDERLSTFLLATLRIYRTSQGAAFHRQAIQGIMDTNVANPEKLGQALELLLNITSQSTEYRLHCSWFADRKSKDTKITEWELETERCFATLLQIKDNESQLDMWLSILRLVKHYTSVITWARKETPFFNSRIHEKIPKFYAEVQGLIDSRKIKHFPVPIVFQEDCFPYMTSPNPVATIKSILFLKTLHLSRISDFKNEILSYSEPWIVIRLLLLINHISSYENNADIFEEFLHNESVLKQWLKLISAETSIEKQDEMMREIAMDVCAQWIKVYPKRIMLTESAKLTWRLI